MVVAREQEGRTKEQEVRIRGLGSLDRGQGEGKEASIERGRDDREGRTRGRDDREGRTRGRGGRGGRRMPSVRGHYVCAREVGLKHSD